MIKYVRILIFCCFLQLPIVAHAGSLADEFEAYQAAMQSGQTELALSHAKAAYSRSKGREDHVRATLAFNYGELLVATGKFRKALKPLEQSRRLFQELGDTQSLTLPDVLEMMMAANRSLGRYDGWTTIAWSLEAELQRRNDGTPYHARKLADVRFLLVDHLTSLGKIPQAREILASIRSADSAERVIDARELAKLDYYDGVAALYDSDCASAVSNFDAILQKQNYKLSFDDELGIRAAANALYCEKLRGESAAAERYSSMIDQLCDCSPNVQFNEPKPSTGHDKYFEKKVRKGRFGITVFSFSQTKEGRAEDIRVLHEIPAQNGFTPHGISSLRSRRFPAATEDGQPVRVKRRALIYKFVVN